MLRLVPDIESAPAAIHPLLEDSPIVIATSAPEDPLDNTTTATYTKTFSADELVDILSQPLGSYVESYTPTDVRQGLRALTYPNSRAMKNAKLIGPEARDQLLATRPQIRSLLKVIDHSEHHEAVAAKVHLHDRYLAELATRAAVQAMKPRAISQFCAEHALTVDELKVWRLKGGNRHNRPVDIDELGIDEDEFTDTYIEQRYSAKTIVPGGAPALIPVEDLPKAWWAREPGYIELLRRLPATTSEELGERWEVLLRREDTPRHVVRPQIAWKNEVTWHTAWWRSSTPEYFSVRKRFVYDEQPPEYDPLAHTIVHTSPLLGPVMLAGSLEPDTFSRAMRHLQLGRQDRPTLNEAYRRKTVGMMVAVLHDPYVESRVMSAPSFRNLEADTADQ